MQFIPLLFGSDVEKRDRANKGEMAPGTRNKFGAPVFEPEIFQEQMYCIEGSTCDMAGSFRRPGHRTPFAPSRFAPESDSVLNVPLV